MCQKKGAMLLRCWFYNPSSDPWRGKNILNKLVAYLDGPWCHVELQFSDGYALRVYHGHQVELCQREFNSERYTPVEIDCSLRQATLTRSAAENVCNQEVWFGMGQAVAALTGVPYAGFSSHTFCSKVVIAVLKAGGVLEDNTPANLTPSALYKLLTTPVTTPGASTSKVDHPRHLFAGALTERSVNSVASCNEKSSTNATKRESNSDIIMFIS